MEGVRFEKKQSWEDYNAIMNYARITPPAVKENYVDIAGGDSSLDLTEAVGGIRFRDAKIEFKFTFTDAGHKDEMKNDLHGRRMKFILDRDPCFFCEGRISVTKEERDGVLYLLYLEAVVRPYKYSTLVTIHRETLDGEQKNIILPNSRMPALPQITVTGNVYLSYEGRGYALSSGTYEIAEVTFHEGDNRLLVSGNGTIEFRYRKGRII